MAVPRLLMSEAILAALIAFGPAIDDLNRLVGLTAMLVTIAITSFVALFDRTRIALVQVLLIITSLLATAIFFLSRSDLRGFFGTSFDPRVTAFTGITGLPIASNAIAAAALPCAVTSIAFAIARRQELRSRFLWCGLALGPTLVVLTGSRDATLGLGIGIAALLATSLLPRSAAVATAAGLVLLATVAAPLVFKSDGSFTSRVLIWLDALRSASDYPLSWAPYGSFARARPDVVSAHNTLVQLFVDFGPVGFVALLAAVVNSFRELCFPRRNVAEWALVRERFAPAFVGVVAALAITGGAESLIDLSARGSYEVAFGALTFRASTVTFVMPPLFLVLAAGLPPLRSSRSPAARPAADT